MITLESRGDDICRASGTLSINNRAPSAEALGLDMLSRVAGLVLAPTTDNRFSDNRPLTTGFLTTDN
jgi:hypothetical protein